MKAITQCESVVTYIKSCLISKSPGSCLLVNMSEPREFNLFL